MSREGGSVCKIYTIYFSDLQHDPATELDYLSYPGELFNAPLGGTDVLQICVVNTSTIGASVEM